MSKKTLKVLKTLRERFRKFVDLTEDIFDLLLYTPPDLSNLAPDSPLEAMLGSELPGDRSEELDLEPVLDFMKDYIGHVITDISGYSNETSNKVSSKIVTAVELENQTIKFKLSNIAGGADAGQLLISPTKFGMFTQKLTEEGFEVNSIYRISFAGGYCLEYLDSKGMGELEYQE